MVNKKLIKYAVLRSKFEDDKVAEPFARAGETFEDAWNRDFDNEYDRECLLKSRTGVSASSYFTPAYMVYGGIAGAVLGLIGGLVYSEDLGRHIHEVFSYKTIAGLAGSLSGGIFGACLVFSKRTFDEYRIDKISEERKRRLVSRGLDIA